MKHCVGEMCDCVRKIFHSISTLSNINIVTKQSNLCTQTVTTVWVSFFFFYLWMRECFAWMRNAKAYGLNLNAMYTVHSRHIHSTGIWIETNWKMCAFNIFFRSWRSFSTSITHTHTQATHTINWKKHRECEEKLFTLILIRTTDYTITLNHHWFKLDRSVPL